ncbi:unnamed protein product [Rhizophagus irregularis]|nr:unnamed protein product [Rhizophagus irregularis]
MEKCWDSNPENRPDSLTLYKSILQFRKSYRGEIFDTGSGIFEGQLNKSYNSYRGKNLGTETYGIGEKLIAPHNKKTLGIATYDQLKNFLDIGNIYGDETEKYYDNEIGEQFERSHNGEIVGAGTYGEIEKYDSNEIEKQFIKAEEYRIGTLSFEEDNQLSNQSDTHPQAIYTSRLLNSFTQELKFDDNPSEALECEIK